MSDSSRLKKHLRTFSLSGIVSSGVHDGTINCSTTDIHIDNDHTHANTSHHANIDRFRHQQLSMNLKDDGRDGSKGRVMKKNGVPSGGVQKKRKKVDRLTWLTKNKGSSCSSYNDTSHDHVYIEEEGGYGDDPNIAKDDDRLNKEYKKRALSTDGLNFKVDKGQVKVGGKRNAIDTSNNVQKLVNIKHHTDSSMIRRLNSSDGFDTKSLNRTLQTSQVNIINSNVYFNIDQFKSRKTSNINTDSVSNINQNRGELTIRTKDIIRKNKSKYGSFHATTDLSINLLHKDKNSTKSKGPKSLNQLSAFLQNVISQTSSKKQEMKVNIDPTYTHTQMNNTKPAITTTPKRPTPFTRKAQLEVITETSHPNTTVIGSTRLVSSYLTITPRPSLHSSPQDYLNPIPAPPPLTFPDYYRKHIPSSDHYKSILHEYSMIYEYAQWKRGSDYFEDKVYLPPLRKKGNIPSHRHEDVGIRSRQSVHFRSGNSHCSIRYKDRSENKRDSNRTATKHQTRGCELCARNGWSVRDCCLVWAKPRSIKRDHSSSGPFQRIRGT